jgi:hypothetical protein
MLPADQLPRILYVVYYDGMQEPPAERDLWRRANLPDGWALSSIKVGGEYEPKEATFVGPRGDKAGFAEAVQLLKDATAAALRDGYMADYRIENDRGKVLASS